MKNPKTVMLIGAILVLVGAMTPWATVSGIFGLSQSIYGYQGDGIFSGLAGLIVLIIALTAKEVPGKNYSNFSAILAVLAGLLVVSKVFAIVGLMADQEAGVNMSMGIGLSCLTPLGAFLILLGGLTKIPPIPESPAIQEPITQPKRTAPTE
jgi:hypothetical protein